MEEECPPEAEAERQSLGDNNVSSVNSRGIDIKVVEPEVAS